MKEKIKIDGVAFDAVNYTDVLTAIEVFVQQEENRMIVTPNPEMLVYAHKNENFKQILNSASMAVADGIGILWAAHYLNSKKSKHCIFEFIKLIFSLFSIPFKSKKLYQILPARVTGADLLFKVIDLSQKTGWRIYLLGARPGIADIAIERLNKRYPQAIFAGSFAGTPAKTHEDDLCDRINRSQANILFVAYGSPSQEEWIHRNLNKLKTVKVSIGIGGAIDFAAGRAKRAPKILRSIGLEWLWRLISQPRRIKRIWNATFVFIKILFKLKLLKNR